MSSEEETTPDPPATKFVSGAIWMIALRWAMRFIGLFSTILLARLLTPDDFGLVAMAIVVYGLLESISTASVDLALIREKSESRDLYDSAWTIQIIQGLFIAVLMIALIPAAIDYFDEPRLTSVMAWIALASVIQGFANIGTVAFRKDLDFAREFKFMFSQKAIGFVFTVVMAYILRDYRALVYAMVLQAVIEFVLSYYMHPYRPRLCTRGMKEIWSFSQWLLLSNIGVFLNGSMGKFVVGGNLGTALVGLYHLGVELGVLFVVEIVMPIRRSLFPNLSKLLDHPQQLTDTVVKGLGVMAMLCIPVGFGLFIVAENMVLIILGERWIDAAVVVQWAGMLSSVLGINMMLDSVLQVVKKARLSAIKVWVEIMVLIPALVVVSSYENIEAIAATRFTVAALFTPVMIYFTVRSLNTSAGRFVSVLWRPLLASVGMLGVSYAFPDMDGIPVLVELCIDILLGVISYAVILALLWLLCGKPASSAEGVVYDGIAGKLASYRSS